MDDVVVDEMDGGMGQSKVSELSNRFSVWEDRQSTEGGGRTQEGQSGFRSKGHNFNASTTGHHQELSASTHARRPYRSLIVHASVDGDSPDKGSALAILPALTHTHWSAPSTQRSAASDVQQPRPKQRLFGNQGIGQGSGHRSKDGPPFFSSDARVTVRSTREHGPVDRAHSASCVFGDMDLFHSSLEFWNGTRTGDQSPPLTTMRDSRSGAQSHRRLTSDMLPCWSLMSIDLRAELVRSKDEAAVRAEDAASSFKLCTVPNVQLKIQHAGS
ncbi:hypothetical protein A4X06_0g8891 [Tilletia controversa]|uniref:Uncharacterized protein n=1 Tax=Tilletia controversa TaxID=13291 RepID=A0A8X7SSV1_9BASI|nr:hypothetical protein A4X06_0g8891 [Tilletia controversa]